VRAAIPGRACEPDATRQNEDHRAWAMAESMLTANWRNAATAGVESIFAELLAGVLRVDRVSVDSHFFDDLGADSLVMAHFCARVRKRGNLPPASIKDVYRYPTVRSLATALTDAAPRPAKPPRRSLPDRRVHELFEDRVREHPGAAAAVHGDRLWTYRELNVHANQIARALLARGLAREGVVAVVTERNLDWMASVQFLGRRDAQVKISGFRIEIGEIENTLLRFPGVREGAVVVTGGSGGGKQLVAFYAAQRPLDVNALRDRVRESLPEYMVPSALHWQKSLPLMANGEIDKKALMMLAAELDSAGQHCDAPRTATEHRLAEAWAQALGIPKDQISRRDQFFDLGGTSLSALELVIGLERGVSFKDLNDHPILADLATLVDHKVRVAAPNGSRTAASS
jgi:acyl carrier protein